MADPKDGRVVLPSASTTATRARVVLHVQRLVATAVTTAAISTGCGFDVVDPVPPPARCPNLAEQLAVTASYVMGANGLEVQVTISAPAGRTDVSFAAPTSVTSGTLASSTPGAQLGIRIVPDAGAKEVTVGIDVTCAQSKSTPDKMVVTLTLPAAPKAGDAVTGSVHELNQ